MNTLYEPVTNNRAVHKLQVPHPETQQVSCDLEMPIHSRILHAERQIEPDSISVWYETDLDLLDRVCTVHFEWFGTGRVITEKSAEHITTLRLRSGAFIVHLYWWVT